MFTRTHRSADTHKRLMNIMTENTGANASGLGHAIISGDPTGG